MERKIFDEANYPLQQETDIIIRTAIEIHKTLGAGFLEIVYKDAFEYEYHNQDIFYKKEKKSTLSTIRIQPFPINFMLILLFLIK